MAAPLRAAPEPVSEPIILVIEGQTHVVEPDDPAWPIAYYAREREQQVRQAEGDLRGKRALIEKLREDKLAKEKRERDEHPERGKVERIFASWQKAANKPRCKLTPERFDMTTARLGEDYDEGQLTMAAVGVGANPYVIEGERKGRFETAMQSGGQVEHYANRCPAELRREISGTLFEVAS